jgi:hypothetical protein
MVDEMGMTYGTREGDKKWIHLKILKEKELLGRPRCRWENNI